MEFTQNNSTSPVSFPVLHIYVSHENQELVGKYREHIRAHNEHVLSDAHPNSGFDLLVPETTELPNIPFRGTLINHQIHGAMFGAGGDGLSVAYSIFPRSSIYKTPLMLANSVGVIDAGYRGWLCSAVRILPESDGAEPYVLEKYSRITQLCLPSLAPFLVKMVEREEDLNETTRGSGGFGSTGN
jgi:dUTPase